MYSALGGLSCLPSSAEGLQRLQACYTSAYALVVETLLHQIDHIAFTSETSTERQLLYLTGPTLAALAWSCIPNNKLQYSQLKTMQSMQLAPRLAIYRHQQVNFKL